MEYKYCYKTNLGGKNSKTDYKTSGSQIPSFRNKLFTQPLYSAATVMGTIGPKEEELLQLLREWHEANIRESCLKGAQNQPLAVNVKSSES